MPQDFVLLALAGIGALALAGHLVFLLLSPSPAPGCLTVLPLRGRCEQLEALARYCHASLRWNRWPGGGLLILADLGADEETRRVAEAFCTKKTGVELWDSARLAALAADDTVCKCLRIVLY